MLLKMPLSHVITGTVTVRNFVPTELGLTVEEITTNALPFASAVVAVAASLTVTVQFSASSLVLTALSLLFNVVEPATNKMGDLTATVVVGETVTPPLLSVA